MKPKASEGEKPSGATPPLATNFLTFKIQDYEKV
jgi:hypothetical protein